MNSRCREPVKPHGAAGTVSVFCSTQRRVSMKWQPSFTSFVRWLAVLLLVGLILRVGQHSAQAAPSGQRLRALAGNFLIGYASVNDFWTLSDTATYQATASSEFNILTPENQMK